MTTVFLAFEALRAFCSLLLGPTGPHTPLTCRAGEQDTLVLDTTNCIITRCFSLPAVFAEQAKYTR